MQVQGLSDLVQQKRAVQPRLVQPAADLALRSSLHVLNMIDANLMLPRKPTCTIALRGSEVWTHDDQPLNMWQKQYDYRLLADHIFGTSNVIID